MELVLTMKSPCDVPEDLHCGGPVIFANASLVDRCLNLLAGISNYTLLQLIIVHECIVVWWTFDPFILSSM